MKNIFHVAVIATAIIFANANYTLAIAEETSIESTDTGSYEDDSSYEYPSNEDESYMEEGYSDETTEEEGTYSDDFSYETELDYLEEDKSE